MANLIITVISIALVAVAALMGAYYGGTAFMDGQTKANANTIVTQADQIAAAWTLAATNEGGSYDTITISGVTAASTPLRLVTATYLTAEPKPPSNVSSAAWTMVNLGATGTSTGLNGLRLSLLTSGDSSATQICKIIAQMAAGNNTAVPTRVAVSATSMPPANGKFDCIFEKASGTVANGDTKYIVYKVGG